MSETSDARSDIELDDEAKQLRLAAEKAKYRRAIVEALKAAEEDFPSVVPKVENAPTGSTSVGVGAGSLGPWQAHIRLNDLAAKIAEEAQKALGDGARVLVTEDHVVLEGDWAARIVAAELENVLKRLACLIVVGQRHVSDLPLKLAQYSETWASAGCFLEEEAPRQRWADSNRPQGAPAEAVAAPAPLPAAVVAGALASSVGLIGLLGADFALSAVSVKANASELAILTATNLVQACRETKPTVEVEVAALGGADASRTLTQFRLVLARNEMLTTALRRLQSALAPATMEQADLSARIAHLEKIAHDAVGKALPEAAKLVQDLEALRERSLQLAKAVVPAVSFEVQARKALERVGTTLAAITKGPDGKEAPLLTAVRWERLQKEVTHVLYVTTDSIATDVTTRRSILGTSGVLQYVTSANASWALVNVKTSAVARGGQVNGYDIMAHRLRDGVVTIVESSPQLSTATPLVYDNDRDRKERRKAVARDLVDPLSKLENVARGMVIALVISMILAFTALAFHSIAELIQSAWG